MSLAGVLVWVLVPGAAALTLLCAIGMCLMRDPYQRLHFLAPTATIGGVALAAAFWLGEPQVQASVKVTLAMLLVMATNAVVTHATARAFRDRGFQTGHSDSHDPGQERGP